MNMRDRYNCAPATMFTRPWQYRYLLMQLVRREIIGRYRGSYIGLAWSFLNPLLMLAVYVFFFTVAFKGRWGTEEGPRGSFAIMLFSGLLVHGIFAECITRAPELISRNTNFVKKIVFPLEILPWITVISATFHGFISLLVLLLAQLLLLHTLPWTVIFFPLVIAPFLLIVLGAGWLLAATGVVVRDISQMMGVFTSVMLFLSPVFYPITSLPESVRPWIMLNPLTFVIEQSRAVLLNGALPDWQGLGIYTVISLMLAWIGFVIFQKARKGFADVL